MWKIYGGGAFVHLVIFRRGGAFVPGGLLSVSQYYIMINKIKKSMQLPPLFTTSYILKNIQIRKLFLIKFKTAPNCRRFEELQQRVGYYVKAIVLEIIVYKKVYRFIACFRPENGISVFLCMLPLGLFPEHIRKS
jgi:hypothetical protein